MVLDVALQMKNEIEELRSTIKRVEEETVLKLMKKALEDKELSFQAFCEQADVNGIKKEGMLMLIDKGKKNRVIRPLELFNMHQPIFWASVKVGVTAAEKAFFEMNAATMEEKEAKRMAKIEIEEHCDIVQTHLYDVVDISA